MKVARNDPCYCNSGKKYKKCHYGVDTTIPNIPPDVLKAMRGPEPFRQNGQLVGRPVIATHFKDKRVVAVGSRLYHSLPPDVTFHEFLIIFLKDIIGLPWGMAESEKPKQDQHLIIQWIVEMAEIFRTATNVIKEKEGGDIKSTEASGNVQSLLSLAYDVYSIYHSAELPDDLVDRLKNMDQFQGAKYEIAVAAIFARAGFNIEWIPRTLEKRCEFIATHRLTKQQIIVEAKSRHRQGVLGRPGVREELAVMRSQVGKLYNDALKKPTNGLPFMIFIDINLPQTPGNNDLNKRWIKDIKKMLGQHPVGTLDKPDPFTAMFVTNFSWHYHEQSTGIYKGENVVIVPLYPKVRVTDLGIINLLHDAVNQYGAVPPMFPEDTSH